MSKTRFGPRFESYWLRGWREISKPIKEQGYAINRITFSTPLKTNTLFQAGNLSRVIEDEDNDDKNAYSLSTWLSGNSSGYRAEL